MKKILNIILIVTMILTGCSNNSSKNNISIYVPYLEITKRYEDGKVEAIWEDELSYNSYGAIVQSKHKFARDDNSNTYSSEWAIEASVDKSGKLETVSYNKEIKENEKIYQKLKSFTSFNDDGTIQYTKREYDNSNDEISYIDISTYEYIQIDNIPCLTKQTVDANSSRNVYKIDYEDGMPVSLSCFEGNEDSELELYKVYNYQYDKFGYTSEIEYINYEDDTSNSIKYYSYCKNKYDENDRIIEISITGQNEYGHFINEVREFIYDDNDNIINMNWYNNGIIYYSSEYIYKTIQIKKEYEDYAFIVNSIPDYTWKIAKFDKIGIGYELGCVYDRW